MYLRLARIRLTRPQRIAHVGVYMYIILVRNCEHFFQRIYCRRNFQITNSNRIWLSGRWKIAQKRAFQSCPLCIANLFFTNQDYAAKMTHSIIWRQFLSGYCSHKEQRMTKRSNDAGNPCINIFIWIFP